MKNILNNPNLVNNIAEAVAYNFIEKGDVLMVHKNGDFSKVSQDKVAGRKYQGWVECLSTETLEQLIGIDVETSSDGVKEAEVIANWMRNQK